MQQITINIYEFKELSQTAKEYAINEHGDFLEQVGFDYEDDNGQMKMDYTRPTEDEIIDSIEANGYQYFKNGKMVNGCTFVGSHPKKGTTEYKIEGEVYVLKTKN